MADQILSPIVGKLVDYIAVPVGRLFSYLFRYHANLEEFRSQLSGLETKRNDVKLMIEAAERKGEVILPSVEAWLKRVDAASDESKGFFEEEDAISKLCFNGPLNLKVRYQRSRRAKKKALEFDAIKKDGTFDPISAPAQPLQTWSMNNENEFDFESRRWIFNQIMEATNDDEVGMIGIWGTGGIGKTTLVKRVAKCARDKGIFEEVAMAVVSQKPSVKAIQGEIADQLGLKLTSESESEIGRAGQLLQRLLARKKILIILDDIWNSLDLNDIGIPYGSQHKGCQIILTTRKRDVCEEMGTRKIFKINLLSADEALNLFLQMSSVDRLSEKGRLAQSLSKECGCLPISIAIVARGLLNKPEVSWEDMLNRLRNSFPDERVCDIIKISYDHLSRKEDKMFFLLCALFPEDYEISFQELFEYGLGLNLFERVDNLDEAAVRAQNLVSRLKSQCLLLDLGGDRYVKMHDVIRDVALDIAAEGKYEILVPKKTAIFLESDDVKKLPDALACPQLRILSMTCGYQHSLHDNFFTKIKNLIVLDLWSMKFVRLPQSFAALENLRTLRFMSCYLGDVSAIGKLQNLVSLSFYSSNIEVLPKEVGELSNLRFLDLSYVRILKVITLGVIQNLSRLEVLCVGRRVVQSSVKQVCNPVNAILSELIHLPRLMILQIGTTDASVLPDDMQLFETLTKFKVSIGEGNLETIPLNSQILKLTHLSGNELSKPGIKMLMKKAQYLEIEDISGISVALPSPLVGYGSVKKLIVRQCEDINYVLDLNESEYQLGTPPQLLHLVSLPLLKEISRGKFPSWFVSKLEHLKLHELPSLVRLWPFLAESNLTTVEVSSCNKLEYVFDRSNAKSLLKLKELEVGRCTNLQAVCRSKEQDDVIVFPQLNHLRLLKLQNLTSFGPELTLESTLFGEQVILLALKTLYINNLEKLEKIWHIHAPIERFFQLKVLALAQCSNLLVVFPPQATSGLRNLETLYIGNCDKLETLFESDDVSLTVGHEIILLPCLLTLNLVNLPKFTGILSSTSQNASPAKDGPWLTFFPKLKELELEGIGHLSSSTPDPLHIIKGLEVLEELVIKEKNSKTLPQANDKTLPQVVAALPKLRKLELGFIHEPVEWCESLNRSVGFQSLTSLNFFSCNGVKSLLRPSAITCLMQLQKLFVAQCESMESIVGEMNGEQNFDKVIEFSKLRTLGLDNLPGLTSFYDGECALKFPCLDDLSIVDCPKLRTLATMASETPKSSSPNFVGEALFGQQVSFGRLRDLKLRQLESIEEIWGSDHPATNADQLTYLNVICCDKLWKLFPSNLLGAGSLQNLSTLVVYSCRLLEHVFAVEDHPPLLSNLRRVELGNLPKLKQLWWNKNNCESFGIPKLHNLMIYTCPALKFIFDPSVGNRLEKLIGLTVENCLSMVEIVAEKPGKKIEFPDLNFLCLVNLPCFKVKQDAGFQPAMLMNVVVDRCFNMKESCDVNVEDELAGSVRYFESFVE